MSSGTTVIFRETESCGPYQVDTVGAYMCSIVVGLLGFAVQFVTIAYNITRWI